MEFSVKNDNPNKIYFMRCSICLEVNKVYRMLPCGDLMCSKCIFDHKDTILVTCERHDQTYAICELYDVPICSPLCYQCLQKDAMFKRLPCGTVLCVPCVNSLFAGKPSPCSCHGIDCNSEELLDVPTTDPVCKICLKNDRLFKSLPCGDILCFQCVSDYTECLGQAIRCTCHGQLYPLKHISDVPIEVFSPFYAFTNVNKEKNTTTIFLQHSRDKETNYYKKLFNPLNDFICSFHPDRLLKHFCPGHSTYFCASCYHQNLSCKEGKVKYDVLSFKSILEIVGRWVQFYKELIQEVMYLKKNAHEKMLSECKTLTYKLRKGVLSRKQEVDDAERALRKELEGYTYRSRQKARAVFQGIDIITDTDERIEKLETHLGNTNTDQRIIHNTLNEMLAKLVKQRIEQNKCLKKIYQAKYGQVEYLKCESSKSFPKFLKQMMPTVEISPLGFERKPEENPYSNLNKNFHLHHIEIQGGDTFKKILSTMTA